MNELNQQVQAAIKQAKQNLKDGKLKPDDADTLDAMQEGLEEKINKLTAMKQDIVFFRASLFGHYS